MKESVISSKHSFALPSPGEKARRLAAGWLALGMAALVAAGLFSILLVVVRTPYLKDIIPWEDFFKTAMVVHVNLSVLMWFLPIAGLIWSFSSGDRHPKWGWLALGIAALGTVIVTLAPFAGSGAPLMNNYFPVVDGPVFLFGLSMFGFGFLLLVIRSLVSISPRGAWNDGQAGLRFGTFTAVIAAAVALLLLIWSYIIVPDSLSGKQYYETLFWGAGHVLQFTHTLLMLVGWLWLASAGGVRVPLTPRVTTNIFGLGTLWVFLAPLVYLTNDIASLQSTLWFTVLMSSGGSVAALPLSLAVLLGLIAAKTFTEEQRVFRAALVYSIGMFGVGGVFGALIQESSTLITAHYHGSNGAITLAFMGLCYLLLPHLNFRKPHARLAKIQIHAFGLGQLLHVVGLAWAGGYGMQRKVAGSGQSLENFQQTAGMTLMGIGGLIAVIGGVLFLVVVFRAMWPAAPDKSQPLSSEL